MDAFIVLDREVLDHEVVEDLEEAGVQLETRELTAQNVPVHAS